jgi:hypothetical protein
MINNIPGIDLPFKSATTMQRQINAKYEVYCQGLKEELA